MQYPFDFTYTQSQDNFTLMGGIITTGAAIVVATVLFVAYYNGYFMTHWAKYRSHTPAGRGAHFAMFVAVSMLIALALIPEFTEPSRNMSNPTSDRDLAHRVESHYDIALRPQNTSDDHPYYQDAIFASNSGQVYDHHTVKNVQFYDDHHIHHGILIVDIHYKDTTSAKQGTVQATLTTEYDQTE